MRLLRLEFAVALHHFIVRGDRQESLLLDDVAKMAEVLRRYKLKDPFRSLPISA